MLANISALLDCLRVANATVRWIMLHATSASKKMADSVSPGLPPQDALLSLLLDTAVLEFEVCSCIKPLLTSHHHLINPTAKEGP